MGLEFRPLEPFAQNVPQKDSHSAGKVDKVLNRSERSAIRGIICLQVSETSS